MKTTLWVFRENYAKSEANIQESGDYWPIRGSQIEECLSDTFRVRQRERARLCLDFMGDAISDGTACEQILWVGLVDYVKKHNPDRIKKIEIAGTAERHFIEGNIHGWKLWRDMRSKFELLGQPDMIVMRPKWAGVAWSYEFSSMEDYNPYETFSRIYAFFRIIEKLYALLEEGWELYVEVYAPVIIDSHYGTYSVFQRILWNFENQSVRYIYGNHDNITALKIRKSSWYPPLKLLRKRIDEYFGMHKEVFQHV